MNKHTAQLLEQHFDTAFAAPDGIAKLRELILTLAMQGKLVEQDPNDPPASELLKEIEAEKQRQVKAGKIKQPKPLPPIKPEEVPYELPEGWEWVRLGGILTFEYGDNLPANKRSNSGEFPVYGSNGVVGTHSDAFVNEPCIVIGRKGSAGALNMCAAKGCCVTDVAYYCIPPKAIDLNFCFNLLRTLKLDSLGKGIKPGLNRNEAYDLIVAIPQTQEQHRIVARIDQLMAHCDELEKLRKAREAQRLAVHAASIKQLLNTPDGSAWDFIQQHFGELYTVKENIAELRKAILQLAVMGRLVPQDPNDPPASELLKDIETEKQRLVEAKKIKNPKHLPPIKPEEVPYELPQGWAWVRLGEIGVWKSGSTPSRSNAIFYGGDIPWVKSGEVKQGRIKTTEETITQAALDKCSLHINEKGAVLVAMYGANIGEVGVLEIEAATNQAVCACKTYTCFDENYLLYLITSLKPYFLSQGAGAAQPNISREKIVATIFPLPPLFEQHRIVTRIDQLMALCDTLEQQIDAATVKQSELLTALLHAQPQQHAGIIDLSAYRSAIGCYVVGKLANTQYFGRTAAAKVMYLAQAHVGLTLDFHPEREAAGPLDKWIYDFERQGQRQGWFEVNEKTLASGRKKTEYRCLPALSEPAEKAEALMSAEQQAEFDRLLYALADKKTEGVEIIATLFAAWNDFLIDGIQPTDEQIIADVRENWHERKARFSPAELGRWLDWLRSKKLVPQGRPPRTVQQPRLRFD